MLKIAICAFADSHDFGKYQFQVLLTFAEMAG